ncbi:MAG TPA: GNAT family N-acetyltransferase [Chryseosolibacter sp.]|nr:GNAT family N-acetyltransferase [Chryseosolibacter sp.]
MTDQLEIKELTKTDPLPYDLLLLADPSRKNIDQYIFNSTIYVANITGTTIGCYVLHEKTKETIEIKNISVDSKHQSNGLGTILLNHAIGTAKSRGYKQIMIGTGNSSVGQLYLYQKVGFRITGILPDFFNKHYEEPIIENGIQCRT